MVEFDIVLANSSLIGSTHTAAVQKDGNTRPRPYDYIHNNENDSFSSLDTFFGESDDYIFCYPMDDDKDLSSVTDSSEISESSSEYSGISQCSAIVISPLPSQWVAVEQTWEQAQMAEGFEDSFGDQVIRNMILYLQDFDDPDISHALKAFSMSSSYSSFCQSLVVIVDMLVYLTQNDDDLFVENLDLLGKEMHRNGLVLDFLGKSVADSVQAYFQTDLTASEKEAWRAVIDFGVQKIIPEEPSFPIPALWGVFSSTSPRPTWSI